MGDSFSVCSWIMNINMSPKEGEHCDVVTRSARLDVERSLRVN
jgi:hypothetical protein